MRVDPQLLTSLTGKSGDQALAIVEEQLAKMSQTLKGRQNARKIAEALFGTGDMAQFASEGLGALKEALARFYKPGAGASAADVAAAKAFAQSIEELQAAFSHMTKYVGKEVTPQLTAVMDAVSKFVQANEGKVGTALKNALSEVGEALNKVNWPQTGEQIKKVADAMVTIADAVLHISDPSRFKRQREGGAADERMNAPNITPDMLKKPPMGLGFGLRQKSGYDGSGGLLHYTSFGGATGGMVDTIAAGTKIGLIAAFRELRGEQELDKKGGSNGYTQAAWDGGKGYPAGASAHPAVKKAVQDVVRGFGHRDMPAGSSAGNLTKLIESEAKRAGIDPRILEGIRAGESKHRANYDIGDVGDGGAYGPWQFNMGRNRFGDKFYRDTGIDPRKGPSTIPAMTRYMAEFLAAQIRKDPNYANGGRGSRLHGIWHGYAGPQDANPHWGDSGYKPDPGELLRQHRNTEGVSRRRLDPAELNIKVQGMPGKASYQSDGGDHFGRINIDPGRTRMSDI